MSLAIIGAGFGRTGTMSLKFALEQLGFGPCYHMIEYMARPEHGPLWQAAINGEGEFFDRIYSEFPATVDWPSVTYWRELVARYPAAKVILTARDADAWWKSFSNTIYLGLQARQAGEISSADHEALAMHVVITETFGDDLSRENVLRVYDKHNATVREMVPAQRLLEYDVSEGWEPLCRFLGVDIPDTPFPRTNSTEEFRANFLEPSS